MTAAGPLDAALARPPASSTVTSRLLTVPAFAALYGLCVLASRWLSVGTSDFATVWVPSGLYLAALVRLDRSLWPFLVAGAIVGNVGTDVVVASRAWLPAFGFALVNTVEALTGASLLRALGGVPHLGRVAHVVRFITVAALVTAVPGGLLGSWLATSYYGGSLLAAWRTWWVADIVGVLVVAPPLLTPRYEWQALTRTLHGRRAVEAVLAQLSLLVVVWAVYWHPRSPYRPSFYLLPYLLWITFKFGTQGIMVGLITTAAITIRGTIEGYGPLGDFSGSGDAPMVVQTLVSVGTMCFLCFAAALREREDSIAELRARDQDARVRQFADTAPAMLWASGLDGRRTFMSRGWYELTGLAEGAGLDFKWLEAIHPDDRERARERVAAAMQEGSLVRHRYRIRTADGSYRWVMNVGRPQLDENGKSVGYVGSIIDVHDYTLAADALARADAQLDAVFQGAPVGLAFLDRELRFQRINERLASINGLPVAAHIGKTPPDLLPGIENMSDIMADLRRIVDTGVPLLGVEVTGETPATPGDRREWRENWFPVSIGDAVVGVGVIAEDVTEQKRTEQALRASEARFRTLAESGPVIVWVTEPGGVQYLSPRWADYTGLPTPAEDATDAALEPVHPDDRESARREWFESEAGAVFETEFRLRGRDGTYRWFLSRGVAIAGDDGRILQRVGTYVDIHDRKVAEGELLEEGRRKDEFLAMLAHELRNPLAPIQNAVHILEIAQASSATQAAAREIIGRQLAHIVRLVDDLLDVSRLSRGKLSLEQEVIDLVAVVRETAIDLRPSFEERGIEFEVQLLSQAVRVEGDRTRLAQVVGNLLHNAQKFTPSGGAVSLRMEIESTSHRAAIHVRDTGVGMSEQLLSKVFDEFSQGTQTLDRGTGGLGLGLALVRRFVVLHGGEVEARSDGPGCGSEFVVRLPIHASEEAVAVAPIGDGTRLDTAVS